MNKNRNRIGIFSLFDSEGIVDEFKIVLAKSLREYFHKFIIVINGNISEEGLRKLQFITNHIFLRPNIGYDAGAYKEVLLDYLETEKWELWDDLFLLNDTFYGPIFPWKSVFEIMENRENDFWGLGECLGGG